MASERMIMVPDWLVEEAASLIEQAGMSGTGVSLTAPRLRAALAQPSAGEPVAFSTEHGALFWNGSPQDWKGKPVQLYLAQPAAAHGDELVAVVGTVPDGSGFKSLDFKVALESLPNGTRLFAMRAQAGEGGEV